MEIEQLAQELFRCPPKEPRTVDIQVENIDKLSQHELFDFLLNLFNEGMKILYSNENGKVDIDSLSTKEFYNFDLYYKSFGFRCHIDSLESDDIELYTSDNVFDYTPYFLANLDIKYKGTFRELVFTLKTEKKLYFIGFSEFI